jgi:hypothetical protein
MLPKGVFEIVNASIGDACVPSASGLIRVTMSDNVQCRPLLFVDTPKISYAYPKRLSTIVCRAAKYHVGAL